MGRIPSRHTHLWLKLWNHISWMVQVLAVFNASAVGITWQVGSTQDFKRYKIWRPWVFLALVDQIQWTDLIWWISHELAVFYDPKSYITLRDNDGEWALWELLRKVPLSSDEKSILSMIVIMFSECMFSLYQSVIWLASNRKVPSLVWDCTLLTISYIYVYIYIIYHIFLLFHLESKKAPSFGGDPILQLNPIEPRKQWIPSQIYWLVHMDSNQEPWHHDSY